MAFGLGRGNEMSVKITANTAQFNRAIASATTRIKSFKKIAVAAAAGVAGLTTALAKLTSHWGEAEKEARQVYTLMDESEQQFQKMKSSIRDLGVEYGITGKKGFEAWYQIRSATFEGAEALAVFEQGAKAAVAGVTDQKTAVAALTSVLNAYGKDISQVDEVSDTFFQTIETGTTTFEELAGGISRVISFTPQIGVTFEEVGAALATLTRNSQNTDEAITNLGRLIIEMAVKPSEAMIDVAQRLGYEGETAAKKLLADRGLYGAIKAITEEIKGTDESWDQLIKRQNAFRAASLLSSKVATGYAKDIEEMGEKSGATTRKFEKMTDTLWFQKKRLSAAFDALGAAVGGVFGPALKTFINNTLTPFIERLDSIVRGSDKVRDAIYRFVTTAMKIGGVITITYVLARAFVALMTPIGQLMVLASGFYLAWRWNLLNVKGVIQELKTEAWEPLVESIKNFLSGEPWKGFSKLGESIGGIFETIGGSFKLDWEEPSKEDIKGNLGSTIEGIDFASIIGGVVAATIGIFTWQASGSILLGTLAAGLGLKWSTENIRGDLGSTIKGINFANIIGGIIAAAVGFFTWKASGSLLLATLAAGLSLKWGTKDLTKNLKKAIKNGWASEANKKLIKKGLNVASGAYLGWKTTGTGLGALAGATLGLKWDDFLPDKNSTLQSSIQQKGFNIKDNIVPALTGALIGGIIWGVSGGNILLATVTAKMVFDFTKHLPEIKLWSNAQDIVTNRIRQALGLGGDELYKEYIESDLLVWSGKTGPEKPTLSTNQIRNRINSLEDIINRLTADPRLIDQEDVNDLDRLSTSLQESGRKLSDYTKELLRAANQLLAGAASRKDIEPEGRQAGGFVGMIPGTGRGDKIPILAEPGEYVLSRQMLQQMPWLKNILPGFQEGGKVDGGGYTGALSSLMSFLTTLEQTLKPYAKGIEGKEALEKDINSLRESFKALLGPIKENKREWQDILEEKNKAQNSLGELADKSDSSGSTLENAANKASSALSQLAGAIPDIINRLGIDLGPIAQGWVDGISAGVSAVSQALSGNFLGAILSAVKGVASIIGGYRKRMKQVMETAQSIVVTGFRAIVNQIQAILGELVGPFSAALKGASEAMTGFVKMTTQMDEPLELVKTGFQAIMDAITGVIETFWKLVKDTKAYNQLQKELKPIWAALGKALSDLLWPIVALVDWVKEYVGIADDVSEDMAEMAEIGVPEGFKRVRRAYEAAVPGQAVTGGATGGGVQIPQWAKEIIEPMKEVIKSFLGPNSWEKISKKILAWTKQIWQWFARFFKKNLPAIVSATRKFLNWLLGTFIPEIGRVIIPTFKGILNYLEENLPKAFEIFTKTMANINEVLGQEGKKGGGFSLGGTIVGGLGGAAVGAGIGAAIGGLPGALIGGGIGGVAGAIGGAMGLIPGFQHGAYVSEPTLGMFGERGNEWVLPEKKLRQVAGGNSEVHVYLGRREVTDMLIREVRRKNKGLTGRSNTTAALSGRHA